jgi:hypothetical protein
MRLDGSYQQAGALWPGACVEGCPVVTKCNARHCMGPYGSYGSYFSRLVRCGQESSMVSVQIEQAGQRVGASGQSLHQVSICVDRRQRHPTTRRAPAPCVTQSVAHGQSMLGNQHPTGC